MKTYGIPEKFIRIIRLLYVDILCTVIVGSRESAWFKVISGVKQGCVMSGFLFLLVVDWLMRKVTKNNNTGIRWKMTSKLEDLDFADNLALISPTFKHIEDKTNRLNTYAKQVGLVINVKKTKLLRINNKDHRDLNIGGQAIENVENFSYLGARVSTEGGVEEDIYTSDWGRLK